MDGRAVSGLTRVSAEGPLFFRMHSCTSAHSAVPTLPALLGTVALSSPSELEIFLLLFALDVMMRDNNEADLCRINTCGLGLCVDGGKQPASSQPVEN